MKANNLESLRKKIINKNNFTAVEQAELLKALQAKKFGLVWDSEKEPEVFTFKGVEYDIDTDLLQRTLVEDLDRRVQGEEGKPQHVLMDGDNYHSLQILQTTHKNKIDIIYIDPPYNTGNEFIYNDKRVDTEDGYRHSKWLNFMDKRLRLAKDLLQNDGICFLSIGDDELANLTLLSDQIFGRQNRITIMSRITKKGGMQGKHFSSGCDYILVYAKDITLVNIGEKRDIKNYPNVDDRGNYQIDRMFVSGLDQNRPNCRYWIKCPDGSYVIPPGTVDVSNLGDGELSQHIKGDCIWRWSQKRYNSDPSMIVIKESSKSRLIDQDGNPSKWNVYAKAYYRDDDRLPPKNFLDNNIFSNANAAKEIKNLFGYKAFDFPKPTSLIKYLIEITNKPSDITVLDFFAGSGTTGHAVLDMNAADNGTRKFIMCALNDPDDEADICSDVTYERIRKVTEKYNADAISGGMFDGFPPTLKYLKVDFRPNSGAVMDRIYLEDEIKEILNS